MNPRTILAVDAGQHVGETVEFTVGGQVRRVRLHEVSRPFSADGKMHVTLITTYEPEFHTRTGVWFDRTAFSIPAERVVTVLGGDDR